MTDFQAKAVYMSSACLRAAMRVDDHDIAFFEGVRDATRFVRGSIEWSLWKHEDPTVRKPVVTMHGTSLKRFNGKAGKRMGNYVYIHRNYAHTLDGGESIQKAAAVVVVEFPSFMDVCNCVRFDMSTGHVRFDESPNFDYVSEPNVGRYKLVDPYTERIIGEGRSDFIWHHKWMWVGADYTGFDVLVSEAWSRAWLKKVGNPSGSLPVWQQQLADAGILETAFFDNEQKCRTTKPNFTPFTL